jgi:hypothetical protein
MVRIKINNTNLELVKLEGYSRGVTRITGLEKKKMKYQVVYFTSPTNKTTQELSTFRLAYGVSEFSLDTNVSTVYDEAWVIQKRKNDEFITYDRYDYSVLLGILYSVVSYHLDTAELLCHAIGDGPILNLFYGSFGNFGDLKNRIKDLEENPKPKFPDKNYALQYQRSKYSVYDLLYDLVKDRAEVYVGPDLVNYKKMSGGPGRDYKGLYSWSKVSSILGNRERANLHIISYSMVNVDVPENKLGVDSGKRSLKEYKTNCIIKDGVLWTRELGVKISPKLHRKLCPTGCIVGDLLFEGDYLLDLSKLPVISKKYLRVTQNNLASAEVRAELLKSAIHYKTFLTYMKEKGLTKAPVRIYKTKTKEEAYLNSLGIYGDSYTKLEKTIYAKRIEHVKVVATGFELPCDPVRNVRDFINKGYCNDKKLEAYLRSISPKISCISLEELQKEKDEQDRKVRDLKFRLILGKYLKFTEHLKPGLPRSYSVDIPGNKKVMVRWENKLKELRLY